MYVLLVVVVVSISLVKQKMKTSVVLFSILVAVGFLANVHYYGVQATRSNDRFWVFNRAETEHLVHSWWWFLTRIGHESNWESRSVFQNAQIINSQIGELVTDDVWFEFR